MGSPGVVVVVGGGCVVLVVGGGAFFVVVSRECVSVWPVVVVVVDEDVDGVTVTTRVDTCVLTVVGTDDTAGGGVAAFASSSCR
ncbi:hypothetical protein [Kutzneria kofuensis]|uniref:Uncharacterized protein n=1 Tax=Kutzneria kofuensis TaxID=103725 RepID=A0A7W9KKW4_9PSEU|nr:hypothetical protein [Kutzneria kofuensis]MBB5894420.1 hypothetical protein [Kutzneria kofuensis]